MNLEEIIPGIRKAWSFLKHSDVGLVFSNPAPLVASDNFKNIATDGSATYEEVYLAGLAEVQYNFSLQDYSFIQLGGWDENSLRFAYYPNPFLGSSPEAVSDLAELRAFVDEGALEVEDFMQAVSELRSSQHPPLLRYENSFDQYVDLVHPCSHIHFGHHAENRWPLRRIVSPQAFTLLIIKQFYPSYWTACKAMKIGEEEKSMDEIMLIERQNCRILPDEFFSQMADRHFHIA